MNDLTPIFKTWEWTEDRVTTLKKLWTEGYTASQIAAIIFGPTRNSVIGKARRLNLERRAPTRPRNPTTNQQTKKKMLHKIGVASLKPISIALVHRARVITSAPIPKSKQIKLFDLTAQTCRWPIGDPRSADFCFCGHEPKEISSYCQFHFDLGRRYLAPLKKR